MIFELNHIGIVVRDLEKSLSFYQDVFGAKVVYTGFIPGTKTDVLYLLITGGMIELLGRREPKEGDIFGITHIAFRTDSLDADFARVVAAGYEPMTPPKTAGSGVGRVAFVRDPNGARVELIERDIRMRDEPAPHPVIRAFDHYSLQAADLDAALKFYRDVFGMRVLKDMVVPSKNLTMSYLNYDYDVLELLHRPNMTAAAPYFGHFALRVDDVDAAVRAFDAFGLVPQPGTPKATGSGNGRAVTYADPDGVLIELLDRVDLRELA